jgi:crotonobetainyl-CoA:carnitine CoA-transferase CaiB-like acyl-CoA transferase
MHLVDDPGPRAGRCAHTAEILAELGYTEEHIKELRAGSAST